MVNIELKNEMMELKKWVVVGVSGNKDKYGYKIWKTLRENGYTTYGVSPNYDELEGEKIYHKLSELPEKVDIIDMVVPPRVSINILDEAKEAGIEYIFFQPGTYNKEVVAKAEELGLKFLIDDCVYATLKEDH
ncbi:MAG: CoA-binding protein [Gudongella sp.]|jgi:predicted CoA-binding protein|nr:CoA-binding protein [Gudongella sp.]